MQICTEYALASNLWLIMKQCLSLNYEEILYSNKEGKKGEFLKNFNECMNIYEKDHSV